MNTPERLELGKVFILPGIEGESYWNHSTKRGLLAGGVPYAMEIVDWTTGWRPLSLYHLRSTTVHQRGISQLTRKVAEYRSEYPEKPVFFVGHSGGGALSLLTLAQLPSELQITGAVLLNPAISAKYDVTTSLARTTHGLWNFCSWGDFFFLGLGTSIMGTVDGKHGFAAGLKGFHPEVHAAVRQSELPPLRDMPYRWDYLRHYHFSGHFGYALQPFSREVLAPLLRSLGTESDISETPAEAVAESCC